MVKTFPNLKKENWNNRLETSIRRELNEHEMKNVLTKEKSKIYTQEKHPNNDKLRVKFVRSKNKKKIKERNEKREFL